MTIINSVIIGGGSGDEVEAYALGDAKNAVKDDKVNLNFSANMATIEPEIQKQAVSSSSGGFIFSIQNGRYIYASQNQTSTNFTPSYKRDSSGNYVPSIGCNHTLGGGYLIGSNVYTTTAGSAYQIFGGSQSTVILPDTVNSSTQVLMSDDGRVLVASNRVTTTAKLIVFTRDDENAPFVELFRYTTENDRVVTRFAFFPGTYDGKYRGVCMRGSPFGGEGYVSYEIDLEAKSFRILKSYSGGKYKYNPICYKGFVVYLAKTSGFTVGDVYVARYSEDGTLTDDAEATMSLRAVISTIGTFDRTKVVDGYLVFGYSSQLRLGYDESKGFFVLPSPFSDKTGGYTFYYEGGIVCWSSTLAGNTNDFEIRRQLAPIEQPYVATEPVDGQYYPNQTLTGIVKENNNGILKVSTVEDPNNPPPAIPDEAGLKTVINYGSAEGANGEVSSALTVSSDTSVSGFYGNAGAVVRAKNPFVDYSGTINSFEVVIPATMTASDSNYHMLGYFGENSSGNMGLLVYYSGRWVLRLKFEGDSNYTDINASSSATLNTKTLVKVTYDSSTGYTLWLSTDDGVSWTNSGASTTTTRLINRAGDFVIGGETSSTDGWRGSIDFKGLYVKINNEEVYKGTAPVFGSVGVGYGYFKNTYFYPLGGQASKDKYVPYDGGLLTEDDVLGRKATTMNIILGRNADMGSWTSDTKGYLSAQEAVVLGVNKKLPTPVYLWHDLSYITPVVPETIEAVVDLGANTVSLPASWKTLDGVVYAYPDGFPATQASVLEEGQVLPSESSLALSVRGSLQGLSENYIVSGFSPSNNLYKAEKWWNTTLTSFEIGLKASVTQESSNVFYGANGGSYGPIKLNTSSLGVLTAYVNTANSNPVQIQMPSSKTPPLDKPFYLKLSYESSTGYKFWYSEDGVEYEQIAASSNVTPPTAGSRSTGFMLGYDYQGGSVSYLRGSLYLKDFYIDVNGVRKYNGVLETIGGEAGLYATRTGGSCGLAISSTSPAGVDSSAVIGTVELDANGAITSYTPEE